MYDRPDNLGLKGTREHASGKDYIARTFMICTPHQILFGR